MSDFSVCWRSFNKGNGKAEVFDEGDVVGNRFFANGGKTLLEEVFCDDLRRLDFIERLSRERAYDCAIWAGLFNGRGDGGC